MWFCIKSHIMDYVRDLLGKLTVNENGKADKDVLTEFVDTVTVEKDNIFLWGLWLRNKPTYFRMTTEGRGKKMTARCEEGETSPKSNAPPPKWGKNGRLLSAGCSRDRRTSRTLASKLAITKKPASAGFFAWRGRRKCAEEEHENPASAWFAAGGACFDEAQANIRNPRSK